MGRRHLACGPLLKGHCYFLQKPAQGCHGFQRGVKEEIGLRLWLTGRTGQGRLCRVAQLIPFSPDAEAGELGSRFSEC